MSEQPLLSLPMRPLETIELPRFRVPGGACDTHTHVFGPLDRYPAVAHPHYTLPDGKLQHYLRLMRLLGLSRFVIVQPSFYGTDNSCLLNALAAAAPYASGVVMVSPDVNDLELQRFHSLGVRAIRIDLFKVANEPLPVIKSLIAETAKKAAALHWHLQFYAPGSLVKELIDFFAELDIDFVIDHMGYMLEEEGLTDKDFARLLELSRCGRCWLKLSGPYRIAKSRGYAAVSHLAKSIVEAAPERTIWGSDWPHIPNSDRDTGELLNLLLDWAPDDDARKRILVGNPAALFGFT